MYVGIGAALLAGAMWGITFVAARLVTPYSAFDLAVARNLVFGLLSLLLMVRPEFRPTGISLRDCLMSLLLGFIGYVGIFLSVSFAVVYAGASLPPLVVGLMPVILSVVGNVREKTTSWITLIAPLSLITIGIFFVNLWAVRQVRLGDDPADYLLGAAFSVLALLLWILYGVLNAKVMRRPDAPKALPWTSLHGLGALLGSLPLSVLILQDPAPAISAMTGMDSTASNFLLWAVISGIGGSWIAAWAWSLASRHLPLSLSAQLLVSEVCFGLFYGFIYEKRWPSLEETAGAILMIAGVLITIRVFLRAANGDESAVVNV
ncbi:DMT family transporter [Agrobacterium tumefaciens]|uniref:DMT family transporter n=1 Tax=Agrobacterium tumefaciens TaxID=358 RepID=A0A4D7Z168_AGRTU|nr:DMT family transporter [Agrobacterium tumefaciens]QCL97752.1 DMT family transporter [Agrobacterium tumefaciens]